MSLIVSALMNEKMTVFKHVVQCYCYSCSLIEENRENSIFYEHENLQLFGQVAQRFKAVM